MREWLSNMTAGLVSGLAASAVVIYFAATYFSDFVADAALNANPTCASPTGLRPIPTSEIKASSTSVAQSDDASYGAGQAIDGSGATLWLPKLSIQKGSISKPPLFPDDAILNISLAKPHDIRLVCAVNGLANTFTNYQNWGRVRTTKTWAVGGAHTRTTVLQSLGADAFPNPQFVARNLGTAQEIDIQLIDAYAGLTHESYDPNVCVPHDKKADVRLDGMTGQLRYERGCLVDPTPRAGLSEVYLYEADDRSR